MFSGIGLYIGCNEVDAYERGMKPLEWHPKLLCLYWVRDEKDVIENVVG